MKEDYKQINKNSWNNRVDAHVNSDFYRVQDFKNGWSSLNEIELKLLGDVHNLSILHLQCHFGQDTISLARLGAKVTGVDLSDKAINQANLLAEELHVDAKFICCDIYDLPDFCNQKFDIVYTSYGVIGWLPDLNNWAQIIAQFLKPDGKFIFIEFHPVVWMFNDEFTKIAYDYFNTGAIEEQETGTYADREAKIEQHYIMWNHGLGEVLTALLTIGLKINAFEEYDYSPYNCFKNTVRIKEQQYRIAHIDKKIPMVYALSASK